MIDLGKIEKNENASLIREISNNRISDIFCD